EVAVAHVADDRRDEAKGLDVLLRLDHAFGEPRDRHAHIGCKDVPARPRRLDSPIGIVPRLPETAAVLLLLGPIEADRALGLGNRLEGLDLVARSGLRAVELEEQRGLFLQS